MRFFINHIDDTSIGNNEKVLPILYMTLINDGRHDFHKFHEMIQNADITFSMVDMETGVLAINLLNGKFQLQEHIKAFSQLSLVMI